MAQITTSYDVSSGDDTTLAVPVDDTQTEGIVLSPINRNGADEAWETLTGCVVEVSQEIEGDKRVEYWGIGGGTVAADFSITLTSADITRNIARDGSTLTGTGTGQKFNVGARVRLVNFHYNFNKKASVDRANTWSGAQTFAAGANITPTSTTKPTYHGQRLTTAERDALTDVIDGDWIYNTTLSQTQWREGGAWVTNAVGGTVADGSATVAGKFEEGTVAEQAAHTATGGTGARLIPAVANLVTRAADGTWISGAIPTLNTSKFIDGSIGGIGVASPILGALLIGGGAGLAMTPIGPGTSGQVPVSNGTTLVMGAPPTTNKLVAMVATDSATLTNPTSLTNFDTHTHTIDANWLTATTGYKFKFTGVLTTGTSTTFAVAIKIGGATYRNATSGAIGTGLTDLAFSFDGIILGTAAAGAAVAVRLMGTFDIENNASVILSVPIYDVENVATNATAAIVIAAIFGSSNAGNNTIMKMSIFEKISTTAF